MGFEILRRLTRVPAVTRRGHPAPGAALLHVKDSSSRFTSSDSPFYMHKRRMRRARTPRAALTQDYPPPPARRQRTRARKVMVTRCAASPQPLQSAACVSLQDVNSPTFFKRAACCAARGAPSSLPARGRFTCGHCRPAHLLAEDVNVLYMRVVANCGSWGWKKHGIRWEALTAY